MSLDRSLKAANSLVRHRNVLSRGERIAKLAEEEKWSEGKGVFGLPKVANRKQAVIKAVKEETAEGAVAGVPGAAAPAAGAKGAAAPAAGAKGAAPAAGAKGAAPAAGAKGAAPAAKAAPAKGKK